MNTTRGRRYGRKTEKRRETPGREKVETRLTLNMWTSVLPVPPTPEMTTPMPPQFPPSDLLGLPMVQGFRTPQSPPRHNDRPPSRASQTPAAERPGTPQRDRCADR